MTLLEALTGIGSLVGAGGVASMVVGFLAFKTEAAKGRRGEPPALSVGGFVPTAADLEILTDAMTLLTGATNRLTAALEQSLKRHELDEEVERALATREMQLLVEALKASRTGRRD